MRRSRRSGFTLVEILIAVTLVSLIAVAMLFAIRIALNSQIKSNAKLMGNRRVVGAQRALQQELNGFIPEIAVWTKPESGGTVSVPFFQGLPAATRFVSSYSLAGAQRGLPQILEFAVIPGDQGQGVRLIVNEIPYRGPASAGARIAGFEADRNGIPQPVFFPIQSGANSFVLADRLAFCRLLYLSQERNPARQEWRPDWVKRDLPLAIRIEMVPLEADPGLLHPMTVTAAIRVFRDPDKTYTDDLNAL